MYEKLGSFVARYWVAVILVWVALAVGLAPAVQRKFGVYFTPTWDEVTKDGDLAYLPERMTSVRGQKLYGEAFPDNKSRAELVIVLEREAGLQEPDLVFAQKIADFFERQKTAFAAFTEEQAAKPPHQRVALSDFNKHQTSKDKRLLAVVEVMRPAASLEPRLNAEDIVGQKLISPDKKALIVVCALEHEFIAVDSAAAINKMRTTFKKSGMLWWGDEFAEPGQIPNMLAAAQSSSENPVAPGLKWGLSGSASVGGDTLIESDNSVQNIHLATGVLVLLILLVVYQAPIVVFVPLLTIGIAVFIAKNLVALLTQLNTVPGFGWFHFEIFKTSEIFIFTILFGCGTDFCLFLISRYREEMENGLDKSEAMREALGQVGEALTGSALTTICGLGMMYFADFGKFTYSGPAIALCLAVALLACLTFAPALMRGCGRMVFWPFGVKHKPHTADEAALPTDGSVIGRFWTWTSDHIMRRPGLILIVSIVVMTPFAIEGWKVQVSYNLLADLPRTADSVQGTKMLQRHFTAGETGPITMLAKKDGVDFGADEWRKEITELTKKLYALSSTDIKSVRSLTYPLGDPPKKRGVLTGGVGIIIQHVGPSESKYVAKTGPRAGQVTRFDVIQAHDPFSLDAEKVLGNLEGFTRNIAADPASPWYGATFDFIGTTAGTRDLKSVITSDETLIQQLVVIAVFAVVLTILRRPLICMYLIFTVIFSYLATIGATELVFSWWYGAEFTGLDWKVPIFLFVILVAVGEDYNIYLATRVFEEERRWGRIQGLRAAIIKTGGIITSCGVIMAGTFVSLMTGSLVAMHALGFALTLGVILDTFIVRPVLVPAFLAWLYRVLPEPTRQTSYAPEPNDDGAVPIGALVGEPMSMPAKPHAEMARRTVSR